jgi:potassium-transporting ATPase KdpC subunit
MKEESVFQTALRAITLFTILLGIVYPLIVTLIGQTIFHEKSNGSIITRNNIKIGSILIAQDFGSDKYFTSRPSAIHYNPFPSGGSNLSPTDMRLKQNFETRAVKFSNKNHINTKSIIPSEMLFASASGVDPHISKFSALLQLNRVALKRNLDEISRAKIERVIDSLSHKTIFGILGDLYVNVLELNLKLDELKK